MYSSSPYCAVDLIRHRLFLRDAAVGFSFLLVSQISICCEAVADPSTGAGELKSTFDKVNKACGFEAGQTPNAGPACMKARLEMEIYHRTHRDEIKAVQKEKTKSELKKFEADYEQSCKTDPSSSTCEYKRGAIERIKASLQD